MRCCLSILQTFGFRVDWFKRLCPTDSVPPKIGRRAILPVRHVERACFGVIEIYSNVQAPQSQTFLHHPGEKNCFVPGIFLSRSRMGTKWIPNQSYTDATSCIATTQPPRRILWGSLIVMTRVWFRSWHYGVGSLGSWKSHFRDDLEVYSILWVMLVYSFYPIPIWDSSWKHKLQGFLFLSLILRIVD